MATLTFYNDFADQLGRAVHNFSSHSFKVALTNTAPNVSTHTLLADITQISGGAYPAGGFALDGVSWSETGGVGKLTITDEVITAGVGGIPTFRYAVVYNDSATSPLDALIGYADYGASFSMNQNEQFTLDFDGTNGVLTIQPAP